MEELASKDETEWAAFAEKAQDWLYGQSLYTVAEETVTITKDWQDLAYVEKANKVEPVKPNEAPSGSATFKSLTSGYYIVFPEGGSTGNDDRATDAMLINIPTNYDGGTTWNIKSTFPTVDKTVDTDGAGDTPAADNGSAQVGDIVTFTLTSKVPDMSDYTEFYFAFNDTLSRGLALVKENDTVVSGENPVEEDDVTVTIGGKAVNSGYTVSLTGNVLKVVFSDLTKGVTLADEGKVVTGAEIVVTYKAMITEDAVVGNPALNTVEVEYSNDPNETTHGTSTPDESKVYTYQISIHKYTGEWNEGSAAYLPGAKFVLSKNNTLTGTSPDYSGDEGVIKLAGSNNEYCVATADDDETTYEFTTNNSGKIVIKGLEAGTYYLHEVEAPAGYNKLKEPIKITIRVSGEDASLDAPVYTIGSTPNAASDDTVGVQNKKGIELPETGSIGTIGLTIVGVAIVLVGVLAPRKKKQDRE